MSDEATRRLIPGQLFQAMCDARRSVTLGFPLLNGDVLLDPSDAARVAKDWAAEIAAERDAAAEERDRLRTAIHRMAETRQACWDIDETRYGSLEEYAAALSAATCRDQEARDACIAALGDLEPSTEPT